MNEFKQKEKTTSTDTSKDTSTTKCLIFEKIKFRRSPAKQLIVFAESSLKKTDLRIIH
jgi:hypothetical protein